MEIIRDDKTIFRFKTQPTVESEGVFEAEMLDNRASVTYTDMQGRAAIVLPIDRLIDLCGLVQHMVDQIPTPEPEPEPEPTPEEPVEEPPPAEEEPVEETPPAEEEPVEDV